jgi:hypothetical protein
MQIVYTTVTFADTVVVYHRASKDLFSFEIQKPVLLHKCQLLRDYILLLAVPEVSVEKIEMMVTIILFFSTKNKVFRTELLVKYKIRI